MWWLVAVVAILAVGVLVDGENAYEGPGDELLADREVRERFLGG